LNVLQPIFSTGENVKKFRFAKYALELARCIFQDAAADGKTKKPSSLLMTLRGPHF
jgi:hypothetical protein